MSNSDRPYSSSRAYSKAVLRHLTEPSQVGPLRDPAAVGEAGSQICGDLVRIGLSVHDGLVSDAAFEAFGCPATIATASESVARVLGTDLLGAARLGHDSIAGALSLPEHKRECSVVAADALHAALEDWVRGGLPLTPPGTRRPGAVLLGMSGGVDSSAAALFLRDQGFEPVGVTFRLWSDPSCRVGTGCCSPETIMRARRVAHSLDMPHLTVDLTSGFRDAVVQPFIEEYAAARTPNPCVLCNSALRFSSLLALADRLGIDRVATGHYARVTGDPPRLHRGADATKDQAYVLARVDPTLLERVIFPLGQLTKVEVRARAREAGIEAHDAPESQEICFIPDDDYRRFLTERLGESPGPIVDGEGRQLGAHSGAYRFTIGQRKGLGIASSGPLYVTEIRSDGTVVVGSRDELLVDEVVVGEVVRHSEPRSDRLTAQLRSSGLIVDTEVTESADEGRVTLRLTTAVAGVAKGQTAALFEGDRLVLAGVIEHATRRSRK